MSMRSIMVNRILATLLLFLFVGGTVSAANATAQDPDKAQEIRKLLEQRDREIKNVLGDKKTFTDAQRAKLKEVVNKGIDFEAMGRQALGEYWKETTPKQREEFVEVFSEIVRAQSLSNLEVYRSKVTYKDVKVEGASARVLTTTVYKDVPTEVSYVMGLNDGEWMVQDIILDDVSTADGYARSFQTVIRKKGFDALMTSLNKKLEKMKS